MNNKEKATLLLAGTILTGMVIAILIDLGQIRNQLTEYKPHIEWAERNLLAENKDRKEVDSLLIDWMGQYARSTIQLQEIVLKMQQQQRTKPKKEPAHEHIWVVIGDSYTDGWQHMEVCVICHVKRIVNGE